MQFRRLLLIAFLGLAMSTLTGAEEPETVWSGLVIAENVPQPEHVPPELSKLEPTLKDLFGYNQFKVIGSSRKTLKTGQEDWLAASKYFSLHVDAHGVDESGYDLNLKLWQEKQMLLEWDSKLSRQSPLVIKGPQVGSGQLLLVLTADEGNADKAQSAHHHRRKTQSNSLTTGWRRLTRMIRSALP